MTGIPLIDKIIALTFRRKAVRAKLEEELVRAFEEGKIVGILNDASNYSRPSRFWLMLPFGWDRRNFKRANSLMCAFTVWFSFAACFWVFAFELIHGNVAGLALAPFPLVIMFGLASSTIENSITESDPECAILRNWLIFVSHRAGKPIDSVEEINKALESYHTPVPREHYVSRYEQLRRLRKPMFGLFAGIMGVYLGAVATNLTALENPFLSYPLFALMMFGLLGMGFSDIYENYYRPVLFMEYSEKAQDALMHGLGMDVDEVVRVFDSSKIHFKVKFKAWLGYLLGPLSGWNPWELGLPLCSVMLCAMYLAAPYFVSVTNPTNANALMFNTFKWLVPVLLTYSVFTSWRAGGGYKKAMERRTLLWHIVTSFSMSELMNKEVFNEILASASYNKEVPEATDNELLTRMFVESFPGNFR